MDEMEVEDQTAIEMEEYEDSSVDQLTAELVKVRASGAGTSQAAEARDSIEKPFSHWIRGAPKEKMVIPL